MNRLSNPLESTTHDPRNIGVAVWALKRGRNGEGTGVLEIVVDNVGRMAVFGELERNIISDVIEHPDTLLPAETLGDTIADLIVEKLNEERK